jgi:hypothetical protein
MLILSLSQRLDRGCNRRLIGYSRHASYLIFMLFYAEHALKRVPFYSFLFYGLHLSSLWL